jgi:DNA repair protein SbcD/Mre11
LRILHTADWHLGKTLENISRIDEQKEFIDSLFTLCQKEEVDLVIIAGDIFDTYNPSAKAEELFYSGLDRLNNNGKRPIVVIAGNHDNPDRLSAAAPIAFRNGIYIGGYPGGNENISVNETFPNIGEGYVEVSVSGCAHHAMVVTLPYPSEARLKEVLSESGHEDVLQKAYSQKVGEILAKYCKNFREDTVNIVTSHLFILGGVESESERTLQVGGAFTVRGEHLPRNAHYIALGHLHRPQQVKNSPSPTYYSGSPIAYSFSESDYSKALYIIDVEPQGKALVTQKTLDCGKPLQRWRANSIEEALEWARDGRDKNAWIDLEVITDRVLKEEEQRNLRKYNSGILNIRPILRETDEDFNPNLLREGRKVEDLFLDFYKSKTGMDAKPELIETLIELLTEKIEEEES